MTISAVLCHQCGLTLYGGGNGVRHESVLRGRLGSGGIYLAVLAQVAATAIHLRLAVVVQLAPSGKLIHVSSVVGQHTADELSIRLGRS